ncbi:MAG: helix-turn-helix transcriptional regulator [Bacteroidales bacterium]
MPILLLVPLFIGAIVDYKWPAGIRTGFLVCSGIVFTIGLLQLYRCVVLRYKYVSADLSRGFILSTYVILSMRMVIIVAEFSIMNPWMKMYCDLLFSFFTFYTVINGIVLQRLPMKGATDKTISTDLSEGDNLLQIKTQSTRAAIDVSSEVDELTALGELIHQVIREKELFRQPHLKLSSLCEHLPSNRTYVSAAINKIDNRGFYGFILSFRIDYACKLMKEQPDMRIEEVALCAGFSSQKIFSRLFRQEMGMSPSVYRGMQVVKDEKIILVATE